jgi:hypothetical protein
LQIGKGKTLHFGFIRFYPPLSVFIRVPEVYFPRNSLTPIS